MGNCFCDGIPGTIRELLKLLEEEKVTIILESGDTECVEVEAVVGNLLVATINEHEFKFIDIDCICAVIVECEDILENIFRCGRKRPVREHRNHRHHNNGNCEDN